MLSDDQRHRAEYAIAAARETRKRLARRSRKGDTLRLAAIERSEATLKRAMRPVRRFLAVTQYEPDAPGRADALNLSFRMQRERRKLWKLRQPRKQ
jgi:hypothetical protein